MGVSKTELFTKKQNEIANIDALAPKVKGGKVPILGSQLFPCWGFSTGRYKRFMPFQAIVSRISAGLDVYKFDGLVDHTDLLNINRLKIMQQKSRQSSP